MILSGNEIRKNNIFRPFHERTIHNGLSYGVGPAGYDVRVEFDDTEDIEIVVMVNGNIYYFDKDYDCIETQYDTQFLLASTIEEFFMPINVLGRVHDKSTWARLGLAVQNTVIEPSWHGYLTLELTAHVSERIILRRGDPIAQIVFDQIEGEVTGYTKGKYQHQSRGPQKAILQKDERIEDEIYFQEMIYNATR